MTCQGVQWETSPEALSTCPILRGCRCSCVTDPREAQHLKHGSWVQNSVEAEKQESMESWNSRFQNRANNSNFRCF